MEASQQTNEEPTGAPRMEGASIAWTWEVSSVQPANTDGHVESPVPLQKCHLPSRKPEVNVKTSKTRTIQRDAGRRKWFVLKGTFYWDELILETNVPMKRMTRHLNKQVTGLASVGLGWLVPFFKGISSRFRSIQQSPDLCTCSWAFLSLCPFSPSQCCDVIFVFLSQLSRRTLWTQKYYTCQSLPEK